MHGPTNSSSNSDRREHNQMDSSESPAPESGETNAKQSAEIGFQAWLEGCIAMEPPACKLNKANARSLNGAVVDDGVINSLAAALLIHDRDLRVSSALATGMLRHHGYRRLCELVSRVIRTRLQMQDETRCLADSLATAELDESKLIEAATMTASRISANKNAVTSMLNPPEAKASANRKRNPPKFPQAALQVALGTACLQRQLMPDAASRLFLEAALASKPSRGAAGTTDLSAILKSKPTGAAPIAAAFASELLAFEAESSRARAEERSIRERARQLESEIAALRSNEASLASKLQASEAEAAALRVKIEDEDRLARDREETLRARVSRRLKSDVAMLHEGLDAIRRDPPRVKVMEDHADRVYESLRKELEQLDTGGTS
jgi:hypothetical protein